MNPPAANLVLIGLRGSGKTTLGRRVALILHRPFVDLDDRTAALLGANSAGEALTDHGEPAFRDAEVRALRDALRTTGQVIALGGGTPTAPGAAELLNTEQRVGGAVIVYLRAEPILLRKRLEATDTAARPSLTGRGTLAEVEEVFAARDPLYMQLASHVIEVGSGPADERVAELARIAVPPPP